ncbi:MAG: hypothetical protein ACLQOO_19740 [Terriglobia bacterium]
MRKTFVIAILTMTLGLLAGSFVPARAQGGYEVVKGKAFDSAMPKDFYLEGNAIPTEKRNAALLKTPAGKRVVVALIDTTGYSSQIRQKYIGMVIAEGAFSVCGQQVTVGSYGFGLDKPAPPSDADAAFHLYNQAGDKLFDCAAKKDTAVKQAQPLQVTTSGGTKLVLGKYWLELN